MGRAFESIKAGLAEAMAHAKGVKEVTAHRRGEARHCPWPLRRLFSMTTRLHQRSR